MNTLKGTFWGVGILLFLLSSLHRVGRSEAAGAYWGTDHFTVPLLLFTTKLAYTLNWPISGGFRSGCKWAVMIMMGEL